MLGVGTSQGTRSWVSDNGGMTKKTEGDLIERLSAQLARLAVHGLHLRTPLHQMSSQFLPQCCFYFVLEGPARRFGNGGNYRHRRQWNLTIQSLLNPKVCLSNKVSSCGTAHQKCSYLRLIIIFEGSPPYDSSSCTSVIAIVLSEYFRRTYLQLRHRT